MEDYIVRIEVDEDENTHYVRFAMKSDMTRKFFYSDVKIPDNLKSTMTVEDAFIMGMLSPRYRGYDEDGDLRFDIRNDLVTYNDFNQYAKDLLDEELEAAKNIFAKHLKRKMNSTMKKAIMVSVRDKTPDLDDYVDDMLGELSSFLQTDLIYDLSESEYANLVKNIREPLCDVYWYGRDMKAVPANYANDILKIILTNLHENDFYDVLDYSEKREVINIIDRMLKDVRKLGIYYDLLDPDTFFNVTPRN